MDLQFLLFNDKVPLTNVREIPDFYPRALEITGVDFNHATKVLINESISPSFVIASSTIIYAQIPNHLAKATITNVEVLSSDFTATEQSKISFEVGDNPTSASGLKSMMQTFLKILLTSAGTDAFSKRVGGNVLSTIGRKTEPGETSGLVSDFSIAVNRATSQMRSIQSRYTRLDNDERLLTANVLNVYFDTATTSLIAKIELIPQSGKSAIMNLEL